MKAYEFSTRITADGNLKLPDDLQDLADGSMVRVLVLIDEPVDCAESTESDELDEGFFRRKLPKILATGSNETSPTYIPNVGGNQR